MRSNNLYQLSNPYPSKSHIQNRQQQLYPSRRPTSFINSQGKNMYNNGHDLYKNIQNANINNHFSSFENIYERYQNQNSMLCRKVTTLLEENRRLKEDNIPVSIPFSHDHNRRANIYRDTMLRNTDEHYNRYSADKSSKAYNKSYDKKSTNIDHDYAFQRIRSTSRNSKNSRRFQDNQCPDQRYQRNQIFQRSGNKKQRQINTQLQIYDYKNRKYSEELEALKKQLIQDQIKTQRQRVRRTQRPEKQMTERKYSYLNKAQEIIQRRTQNFSGIQTDFKNNICTKFNNGNSDKSSRRFSENDNKNTNIIDMRRNAGNLNYNKNIACRYIKEDVNSSSNKSPYLDRNAIKTSPFNYEKQNLQSQRRNIQQNTEQKCQTQRQMYEQRSINSSNKKKRVKRQIGMQPSLSSQQVLRNGQQRQIICRPQSQSQEKPKLSPKRSASAKIFTRNVYLQKQTFIDDQSQDKVPTFVEASFGHRQHKDSNSCNYSSKENGGNFSFFNSGCLANSNNSSKNGKSKKNNSQPQNTSLAINSTQNSSNSLMTNISKAIKNSQYHIVKSTSNKNSTQPNKSNSLGLKQNDLNTYYNKSQLESILKQHQAKQKQKQMKKPKKHSFLSSPYKHYKLQSREGEKLQQQVNNLTNNNNSPYCNKFQKFHFSDNENLQVLAIKKTNLPYVESQFKISSPKTQLNKACFDQKSIGRLIEKQRHTEKFRSNQKQTIIKIIDIQKQKKRPNKNQKQNIQNVPNLPKFSYKESLIEPKRNSKFNNKDIQFKIHTNQPHLNEKRENQEKQSLKQKQRHKNIQNIYRNESSGQIFHNQFKNQSSSHKFTQFLYTEGDAPIESVQNHEPEATQTIIQHLNLSTHLTNNINTNSVLTSYTNTNTICPSTNTNTNTYAKIITKSMYEKIDPKVHSNLNSEYNGNRRGSIFKNKKTYINVMSKLHKPSLFAK